MTLRSALLCCALALSTLLPAAARTEAGRQAPLPLTATLREKIDSLARQTLAEQHLAGFSLAIAQDGRTIYTQGYGYRIISKRLPATPKTIYNIGSITKQFTATAVILLQQDGKLNVDDPVVRFISGLPWGRQVSVRQLLNHTSGVPDYLSIVDNNSLTMPKILAALRKTHLKFAPGSIYQYSNSNYILLGAIVAKASGISFDDFLRRRILRPFGLEATSIGTTPLTLPNGAIGYTVVKGRTTAVGPRQDTATELDFPDGGINTNVLDLVKWDAALDSGRIVSPRSLAMMFTPSHHRSDWPYGYGFGLGVDRVNGHREIVHEGEWTGFAGENATFPDDGFAIVMLSNTDGFSEDAFKRKLFRLFFP